MTTDTEQTTVAGARNMVIGTVTDQKYLGKQTNYGLKSLPYFVYRRLCDINCLEKLYELSRYENSFNRVSVSSLKSRQAKTLVSHLNFKPFHHNFGRFSHYCQNFNKSHGTDLHFIGPHVAIIMLCCMWEFQPYRATISC